MLEHLHAMRVLLVDDHPHMRVIVGAILRSAGVGKVFEATGGDEALGMLGTREIDMAIVDFKMAGMDGVTFIRRVRTGEGSPNPYLPIIMMTGFSDRTRVMEARDAGVNDFVAKPVTARSILERVQSVVLNPRPFIRNGSYFGPKRPILDDLERDSSRAVNLG